MGVVLTISVILPYGQFKTLDDGTHSTICLPFICNIVTRKFCRDLRILLLKLNFREVGPNDYNITWGESPNDYTIA